MLLIHNKIDSDAGLAFNDGILSNDSKVYFSDNLNVQDDTITIHSDETPKKTYFISSINSIEIIEKNILLKELIALLFSWSFLFILIGIGLDASGASSSSPKTLFNIFVGVYIIYAIPLSFMHYGNKFFIQISTSAGKEYLYFSKYGSKIHNIFNAIVAIKNSK